MKQIVIPNQQIVSQILNHYGVVSVAVFGSFGRGDYGPESDLDLLIDYKEGMTLFEVIDLQNELEVTVGRPVDLVSRKFIQPRLAKRIKNETIPLELTA